MIKFLVFRMLAAFRRSSRQARVTAEAGQVPCEPKLHTKEFFGFLAPDSKALCKRPSFLVKRTPFDPLAVIGITRNFRLCASNAIADSAKPGTMPLRTGTDANQENRFSIDKKGLTSRAVPYGRWVWGSLDILLPIQVERYKKFDISSRLD